jgi:hypothetical protein
LSQSIGQIAARQFVAASRNICPFYLLKFINSSKSFVYSFLAAV